MIEYIATSEAAKKAIWMKKFITELDIVPIVHQLVPLYYDNTRVVA